VNLKYKFSVIVFLFLINLIYSQQKECKIMYKDSVILHKRLVDDVVIDQILDSIYNEFNYKGYFDLEKKIVVSNDTLKLIQIITNHKIDSIKFNYPKSSLQLSAYKRIFKNRKKKEFIIRTEDYPNFIQSLIQEYANNGFPFVSVKAENFVIKNAIVSLDLNIMTYQKRKIDKFVIKGYESFPNKFLKNYLRHHKNTDYSDVNLKKIATYFSTLPFVSQIKNPEVLFKKDSTLIYLYLKKKKTNVFDGLIGFENSEQTSKIQVNGYLKLKLNNIFNKGNTLNLNWNNNGEETANLDLQYKIPFIFGSPVSNDFHFQLLKKDSTNLNLNIKEELSLLYRANHSVLTSFYYESSNSTLKVLNPNVKNYSKYLIGVGYRFSIPAKTGYETKLLAIETVFNYGLRDKTDKQTILQAQGYYNLQITPKLYFKTTINYKELKSTSLLLNELFAIGGNNTLRGFKASTIFVDKYIILNIDLKKYLNPNSYVKVISDYGILRNTVSSNMKDKIFSIGLGYGFKISDSGFISINYIVSKQNKNSLSKGLLGINLETFF